MHTRISTHSRLRSRRAGLAAASALALAVSAGACTTDDSGGTTGTDTAATSTAAAGSDPGAEESSGAVAFEDAWAKATDTEMSGVFGTLRNTGTEDVHLVGVSAEIDGSHELHETVPGGGGMMMQEKEDGFVIPAGDELTFEPGGNHIMLMGLTDPITTGQQIELTLEFADGSTQDVAISARDFVGGEENYTGGHGE